VQEQDVCIAQGTLGVQKEFSYFDPVVQAQGLDERHNHSVKKNATSEEVAFELPVTTVR
jgi:hypothetical protein